MSNLRAEDNLEVGLAVVADGVSRAAVLGLIRVGPALGRVAAVRIALLARAIVCVAGAVHSGVDGKADVAFTSLHEGEVVSSAVHVAHLTVAELSKSLSLPLAGRAPLSVAGEAQADVLEGSRDGLGLVLSDGDRLRGGVDHVEASSDFVQAKVLGGRAVVGNLDVEGVGGAWLDVGGSVGDRDGCCRQGEQGTEEPACGIHFALYCDDRCGTVDRDGCRGRRKVVVRGVR